MANVLSQLAIDKEVRKKIQNIYSRVFFGLKHIIIIKNILRNFDNKFKGVLRIDIIK
jgi:hypothetical protein